MPGGGNDSGAYSNGLVARLAEALGGQNVPQAVLRRLRDLIAPAAGQGQDGGAVLDVQVGYVFLDNPCSLLMYNLSCSYSNWRKF